MSDSRSRELERRWLAEGDADALEALDAALARAGERTYRQDAIQGLAAALMQRVARCPACEAPGARLSDGIFAYRDPVVYVCYECGYYTFRRYEGELRIDYRVTFG